MLVGEIPVEDVQGPFVFVLPAIDLGCEAHLAKGNDHVVHPSLGAGRGGAGPCQHLAINAAAYLGRRLGWEAVAAIVLQRLVGHGRRCEEVFLGRDPHDTAPFVASLTNWRYSARDSRRRISAAMSASSPSSR